MHLVCCGDAAPSKFAYKKMKTKMKKKCANPLNSQDVCISAAIIVFSLKKIPLMALSVLP